MGYYLRVLSPSETPVGLDSIHEALLGVDRKLEMSVAGPHGEWQQVLVSDPNCGELCIVERNPVLDGELGTEEIAEFQEEIEDCLPVSGRDWLLSYFKMVRTIYAVQILAAGHGHAAIGTLMQAIRNRVGGILQADLEGFSNEEGYHVLWQFHERVTGPWWMAVRNGDSWRKFRMELGNPVHRAHFLAGEVPPGVELMS